MTEQRKIIYRIIMQSDDHPTAEMIYVRAKRLLPSIAVGTVYRNLKLLVDAGEIRHIPIHSGPDRYDRTTRKHDHFICVRCGKVFDCFAGDVAGYIAGQTGVDVISCELNVYCLCDECRQLSKTPGSRRA